jgi:hypothetical protein
MMTATLRCKRAFIAASWVGEYTVTTFCARGSRLASIPSIAIGANLSGDSSVSNLTRERIAQLDVDRNRRIHSDVHVIEADRKETYPAHPNLPAR